MKNPALISKIKALDALSADEKAELIALLNNTKKYGLVWEDKPEDVEELLRTQLPVLQEMPERRILAKDLPARAVTSPGSAGANQPGLFDDENIDRPDNALRLRSGLDPGNRALSEVEAPTLKAEAPNHILIEGDNLHALTALTFTHEGKIDVIYIDPPYNTGNKDFKYNDHFVDREDSYRHSKWLSFMHKRLQIAKRLLSDKGVIFISIDDNEQAQLKMLCDEVFGEQNFISNIIWQKKTGASDAKTIDTITEFVMVFSKTLDSQSEIFNRNTESYDLKRYRYKDEYFDKRGPYYLDTLDRGGLRYSDSLNYGIECPDGTFCFPNGRTEFINDGWTFKWGKEKVGWGLQNKFIDFRKNDKKPSGWTVYYKNYLYVDNEGNLIERSAPLKNMIVDIKNADGAANIKDIFGIQLFKYSKPLRLVLKILNFVQKSDGTILDFFAGSGTTLHATMQLNAEDGGNRQCILVTNNENNIAEEVCYERNRRVIGGYTNSKGQWVDGLPNNNLRYYKTEFVGSAKTEANRRKLTRLSTALLQIKEDCYNDLTASSGFDTESCHISGNGSGRYLVVIYHNRRRPELIEQLREWIKTLPETDEKIRMYAFSEEKEVLLDEFYDVASRIMAVPLPDAIYNAYRATFRTLGFDRKQPQQNGNPADEALTTDEMPELDFNQTEE